MSAIINYMYFLVKNDYRVSLTSRKNVMKFSFHILMLRGNSKFHKVLVYVVQEP